MENVNNIRKFLHQTKPFGYSVAAKLPWWPYFVSKAYWKYKVYYQSAKNPHLNQF